MQLRKRKGFKRLLLAISVVVAIAAALGVAYWVARPNIHTVIPGAYYRSAQLDGEQFARLIKKHHIKAILNLRGASPYSHWYKEETATAQRLGVKHVDLYMRAYVLPEPKTLKQLVHLLQTLPKPLLYHCQGGADRTGLASAIVVLLHDGSYEQAMKQVSIYYFAISKNSVGRLVMPYYKRWLQQRGLKSSRKHFLQWVNQETFKKPVSQ